MGLFDKIFGKKQQINQSNGFFETLTSYSPVFTTWQGSLYESELVRSAIDARARHISKLSVTIEGNIKPELKKRLEKAPNSWQTWSQFLYRLSTILDMNNTAFIVPVFDDRPGRLDIVGYYPVLPSYVEIVDVSGEPYLKYTFSSGDVGSVPLSMCAVMTKFQYRKDFFGESNMDALQSTMDLLSIINQGTKEAVKNSNTFLFMAQPANMTKESDLAKEASRFTKSQFQKNKDSALLLFPYQYSNIKQITLPAYTVDESQISFIRTNVYNYFGVNEDILQNKADGNKLDAFFNGAIEPFAIQFSETMTRAAFTDEEQRAGAAIKANANRLQYMDVSQKINMVQQLGDRGIITIDEARDLFNYLPFPDGAGNQAPIRGEYYMVNDKEDDGKDDDNSEKEEDEK